MTWEFATGGDSTCSLRGGGAHRSDVETRAMPAAVLARRVARVVRSRTRTATGRLAPTTTVGAPDERPDMVEASLAGAGISVGEWTVPADGFARYLDAAGYPDWYLGGPSGGDRFFGQKALEHYVSIELASVVPGDVVVDVASNGSPFAGIVRRIAGARCFENDLQFPRGLHGDRIGGDAASMPVPPGFADVMTLHCSFDHFEGSSDIGFASDAGRVLRAGGRAVILPLYLASEFGAKVDPRLRLPDLRLDPGMRRFLMPGLDVRFSRLYDPGRLQSRVLDPARAAGLEPELLRVRGGEELVPGSYLNFALLLRKPG
jgi:hypothetical protein